MRIRPLTRCTLISLQHTLLPQILQIPGIMDPGAYNAIVTADFAKNNSQAPLGIYNTWQVSARG